MVKAGFNDITVTSTRDDHSLHDTRVYAIYATSWMDGKAKAKHHRWQEEAQQYM